MRVNLLRQPDALRGRDEVPNDREGRVRPCTNDQTDKTILP